MHIDLRFRVQNNGWEDVWQGLWQHLWTWTRPLAQVMVVHVVILWPWPRQEGPPSAVRLLRKGLLLTEYSFSEKGKGMNPSDRSRRMSGFRGCLASKEPCRMFIWTCLYWLMAYPLLSGGRVSEEEVKAGPFYMPSFGFTTRIAKRILINNFLPSSLFFFF